MLQNIVKTIVSNYYNAQYGGGRHNISEVDMVTTLVVVFIFLFILAFFGKILWNEYLVKAVSICKPVNSWLDILAISLLLNILFCR